MAEASKDGFGPDVPARIAAMLTAVDPSFPAAAFAADALDGFEPLELTPRGAHVAAALARHLPASFDRAADLVEASLGPPLEVDAGAGMAPFLHMPFCVWVADAGLDHPERALALQHALTQRFTAEFSIRPFVERHPESTMATLRRWARDPSAHVRRLVSEGTRPRLPWAPRLRGFMRDPAPVLALLELLRDDPVRYVTRSVANNLNDVGKDHPDVLLEVARRWMADATPERRWLVRHALRSLTRAGDPEALAVIGVGAGADLAVEDLRIDPPAPAIGGRVRVACRVVNAGGEPVAAAAHLRVGFVKARGELRPKTFILGEAELAPGEGRDMAKTVSLAQGTTRTHHPGRHTVEVVVNGSPRAEGGFDPRP